ncbi:MAG: Hint domain-containing protein [Rhodobacteraceae bacterium]|nr:Hint domain-containing protein [Paracoccaceae bacterium]
MGWVCIATRSNGCKRLGTPDEGTRQCADLMPRGTLVVETYLSGQQGPQILLGFDRTGPQPGRFTLQALPTGGIVLVDALGDDIRHATLAFVADGRLDAVRISYSWDISEGWGRLTLEHPATETILSLAVTAPRALPMDDLTDTLEHALDHETTDDLVFVALSDKIEPVGPMPALTAQVPVLTPSGERDAAEIRRGDIVITDQGEQVPVLQVVSRTVPALGSFQPVRLRAPFFGLAQDIVVAPAQRLVMHGSEVEYMFGCEAVLVPARHLINERSAFYAQGGDLVTYHHLLLPGHEVIRAGGSSLESLYVGRLRRRPAELICSVLADFDRKRLPEHARPAWPVLKPFEAVTLSASRAA